MADVFVSYARSDKPRVAPLVAAIEAQGWTVWWDPEIPAGQEFDREIALELGLARAVVVVWTPKSVDSRWVRGEAREALDRGILVPVRFDSALLPIDVRALHTTDLDATTLDAGSPQVQEVLRSIRRLVDPQGTSAGVRQDAASALAPHRTGICVLPFTNMSGDPEQEYFSDGISEDIITDLSKVSALSVTSRNSAFVYKGRNVDVPRVCRELHVSHVLEGSVRKSGGRVRITAQLVDGSTNAHLWAERFDRDLNDIFALQDEISQAIVRALKLKLLPEERRAIEQRGTTNVEAYNLYLMARQMYVTGHEHEPRRLESLARICTRATEIDPGYAQAWGLLAIARSNLHFYRNLPGALALEAAGRALALDPSLPEAHAAKAKILAQESRIEEAGAEIREALRLDPENYEANRAAAYYYYRLGDMPKAIVHWEKSAALMDSDINSLGMLLSSYHAIGDDQGKKRIAKLALARADRALAADPNSSLVLGYSSYALATLGEKARAIDRMNRAVLIDPENWSMRYNFACVHLIHFGDPEAALDALAPVLENAARGLVSHVKVDPDWVSVRDHPRFKAMVAAAEARLADPETAAATTGTPP